MTARQAPLGGTDDRSVAPPWPEPPAVAPGDPRSDFEKIRYQAQVQVALAQQQADDDARKATAAADVETAKAAWAAEYAHRQAVDNAYLDVTKGAIDRAQARAQFIQTAAASIATVYAGILALSFKVEGTSPGTQALPVQGILPTVFLGLAIVLVTVYLGWIGRQRAEAGPQPGASLLQDQERRVDAFIEWASALIVPRLYFLHASIVSLAIGVSLLPLAYIRMPVQAILVVGIAAAIVVFAAPEAFHRVSGAR